MNIRLLWTSFIISNRISVVLYRAFILLYRALILPYRFFFIEKSITFWILYYNWSFLWYVVYDYLSCVLYCMTCSCISFHVVYLLNLPFRSLLIPTSPRGRQRQYSFNNIYNKLPSSFCRFLFFSIFSDLVSGVEIYRTVKRHHLFCVYRH